MKSLFVYSDFYIKKNGSGYLGFLSVKYGIEFSISPFTPSGLDIDIESYCNYFHALPFHYYGGILLNILHII